jgi:hypothetical protein
MKVDQAQLAMRPAHRLTRVRRGRTLVTLVLSLAVASASLPATAGHAAATPASALAGQFDAYLGGLHAHKQFSGVVLVAQHGAILLSKG